MQQGKNDTLLEPNDARDRHMAAGVIFAISFTGLLANILVVAFSQRLQSMRNSFGRLLTSQATGETVFCFIFAFYFSPMVFLKTNTKVLMMVSWIVPLLLSSLLYVYYDCGLIYEDSIYAFVWVPSEECKFISWNISFCKDVCIVSIIGVADITTMIKVHTTNTQIQRSGRRDTDQRRQKEINFLKQAVLQGIVFVFELYSYFILAWHFQNKWIIFVLTSVTWTCTHCGDALIIIALNSEFRKLFTVRKRFLGAKRYSNQTHAKSLNALEETRSNRLNQERY